MQTNEQRARSGVSAQYNPASNAANQPVRGDKTGQGSKLIIVQAPQIDLHPMVGLDAETLRRRYEAEVERELNRLRRNQPLRETPEVVMHEGRYLAFSALPAVIAAQERAEENGGCRVAVLVQPAFDAAGFFEKRLEKQTPVSPYEQARMLAVAKEERGSLRDWMRANGLDPKAWDSRCSKLMKLNDLDEAIMSKVDPFTIGSVRDAGQVVDAWADTAKREAMKDVLRRETAGRNVRVPAGPLFKAMLRVADSVSGVARPTPAATISVGAKPEHRNVVSGTGAHIATIKLEPGADWESAYALFRKTRWEEPVSATDT